MVQVVRAVAPKNIPVGKAKVTATAIPNVKAISAVEMTTARREQPLRIGRIAVLPNAMVVMEEADAALKNIPVGKAKETAIAIPSVEEISVVELTTAVLSLERALIAAQPSAMVAMEETDAALKNLLVGKVKATVTVILIVEVNSAVEKITAVLSLERALIAAQTSAMEAEAVAAKNIPVGKVKETATAILSVKEISAVELTTARRGQLLQMARIAALLSAMEATAAAPKNIHAAKKKETATVTRTARATSSAVVTTALKGQLLRTMTTAAYHWVLT